MVELKEVWCYATEDNYNALTECGVPEVDGWSWEEIENTQEYSTTDIFLINYTNFEGCFNWVGWFHPYRSEFIEIRFIDGEFQYIRD